MVDIKYANAYSEVLEILKYIPVEDYNKIPKTKIELFRTNANNNYSFDYNPNKTLQEQEVSKITKGIIAILFRDYWATELQRNKIMAKQNYDRVKLEEKKKEKYNPDNIFSNQYKELSIVNAESNQELALIDTNHIKWYKRICNLIKKLFRKNNKL